MLHEAYLYLTTQCPAHVRGTGYLYEAIALTGRYARNRTNWQPHLKNSRKFVLSAAERCLDRELIVVLGAGLLLDIPLNELSDMFREVMLLDIVFLPGIRRALKRYDNVRLVEHDLTGVAKRLYRGRDLPEAAPAVPRIMEWAGLVVSLNILSQLAVVPREYIKNHLKGIDIGLLDAWCRHIVSAHYESMRSLSCPVCLVSDFRYTLRDSQGLALEQGSTIEGIELPEPDVCWDWDIAPLGELTRSYSRMLDVGAWHLKSGKTIL